MLNFEYSGSLHSNKPLWLAACDRASPPLHTPLPPDALAEVGAPPLLLPCCGAGGSSDPSQGGSWAEAAECSHRAWPGTSSCQTPSLLLLQPASHRADPLCCPALPTQGQRWWPPACTWLDLSAVLWGGSGWLWPRPPTTGWWLAATPSPPAGRWMSWDPRGCGQTVSWQQVFITANPSWTSSSCQVSVSHPPLPTLPTTAQVRWCWSSSSFLSTGDGSLNAIKKVNDSSWRDSHWFTPGFNRTQVSSFLWLTKIQLIFNRYS